MQRMGNEHMRCSAPVNGWRIHADFIRLFAANSLRRFEMQSPWITV